MSFDHRRIPGLDDGGCGRPRRPASARPTTAFALALDEARVGDPEDLRVRATLRSASGTWWTPEAVADWDRVLLVRVADADDQPLVDVPV